MALVSRVGFKCSLVKGHVSYKQTSILYSSNGHAWDIGEIAEFLYVYIMCIVSPGAYLQPGYDCELSLE